MIRIWQSYACNNSSAYRVVARFANAESAAEVAAELDEYIAAQAKDHSHRGGALATLARTYGFDWQDYSSGEVGMVAQDDVIVMFNTMCFGMGPGVAAYVEDRGGTAAPESSSDLSISVLFRVADIAADRRDELFEQLASLFGATPQPMLTKPPWGWKFNADAVCFRDPGTIGMQLWMRPSEIAAFKSWLAGFGVTAPVMRLDDRDELFATLAAARCRSCGGVLQYLDPRLHDVDAPQLLCGPCGGLYDLAAFR